MEIHGFFSRKRVDAFSSSSPEQSPAEEIARLKTLRDEAVVQQDEAAEVIKALASADMVYPSNGVGMLGFAYAVQERRITQIDEQIEQHQQDAVRLDMETL